MMAGQKTTPERRQGLLVGLFDALLVAAAREASFRAALSRLANAGEQDRLLDLGCGTGSLALLLKTLHPEAEVFAVGEDPETLEFAREKAEVKRLRIDFHQAAIASLPFGEGEFDVIVSGLALYPRPPQSRESALKEAFRVLRPGGVFLLAGWEKPPTFGNLKSFWGHFIEEFKSLSSNFRGRLPALASHAGFDGFTEVLREPTAHGTLSFHRARRPI